MRKNSARKWLHAILDLLPVVIIPIFALYSTNKNATFSQEITVSQNKVIDFNQLAYFPNSGNTNVTYTNIPNNSYEFDNDTFKIELPAGYENPQISFKNLEAGKYYVRFSWSSTATIPFLYRSFNASDDSNIFYRQLNTTSYANIDTFANNFNLNFCFNINPALDVSSTELLIKLNIFNLTQMFGEGNEPTITQFNEYFPNDYYDYTLSKNVLLKDYDQITYNDTDIGSQFMYGLYNSVDKYFNIGNVFNLGSIYDWLNLNIFNGNAPIAIYIVWNIVAYEFLMDLLFLLYGLFMFFIDTCTNLMDRFYCTLSGRI